MLGRRRGTTSKGVRCRPLQGHRVGIVQRVPSPGWVPGTEGGSLVGCLLVQGGVAPECTSRAIGPTSPCGWPMGQGTVGTMRCHPRWQRRSARRPGRDLGTASTGEVSDSRRPSIWPVPGVRWPGSGVCERRRRSRVRGRVSATLALRLGPTFSSRLPPSARCGIEARVAGPRRPRRRPFQPGVGGPAPCQGVVVV